MTQHKTLSVISIIIFIILGFGAPHEAIALQVGDRSPVFRSKTFDGEEFNLESFRGKIVLLNFWASWCIPCRQELPFFAELIKEFDSKDFAIIAVNIDKKEKKADDFVSQFDLPFILVRDSSQSIVASYSPPRMPSTYFIDRKGTIRFIKEGFHKNEKETFREEIKKLLEESR